MTLLSTHETAEYVMVETKQLKPGLYVGRTLLPTSHGDVKVCVANTTNKPQLITPGKCLEQPASVTAPK